MLENKPSTNSASPDAKKVKPPFTDLPAFNVAATIMSFLGYQDEMMSLLAQLNHNSILYSERHFEILQSFIAWRPEFVRKLHFYDKTCDPEIYDFSKPYDISYPTQGQLLDLKNQKIKLGAIHMAYHTEINCLTSVQMEFNNG